MSKDISQPEQLITEHIDIWTSAILAKSSSGRGSSKKYELYGISKLRELILELAVRGKLVPQDTNDEPASILLERVAAEKAHLIENGKGKKNKSLPKISNDEKWFSLPSGWKWVRFGELFQVKSGNNLSKSKMKDGDIPVFGGNGITGYHNESNVGKSTIVIGRVGYYCGSVHLTPPEAWITDNAFFTTYDEKILFQDFVIWLLKTIDLQANTSSTAQPVISGSKIYPIVIPLPPIEEQKRIVAKVDELMLLCDQLEQQTEASIDAHATLVEVLLATLTDSADADELAQNWARISEHFDSLFTTEQSIDALKQTVLQLAVMGKLVPQNPDDEPASVLLEKIAEEKEQLIEQGEIKKTKDLCKIDEREKNIYTLPSNWEWERFVNLTVNTQVGLDRGKAEQSDNFEYIYFRMNNINNNGGFNWDNLARVNLSETEIEKYRLYEGDFLFNTRNSQDLVGKTCVIRDIPEEVVVYNNNIMRANMLIVLPEFLDYWFRSASGKFLLNELKSSTTNISAIYQKKLFTLICPVAPMSEQHRIVAKVDELMAICDQLKEKLQQSQETQVQLTDALVDRALG